MADLPKVEAARLEAASGKKRPTKKVAPRRKKVKRYIEMHPDTDITLWRHV